jgi:hypothetical protein
MLQVKVHGDSISIGRHFSVSFQRTLRIPEDGRTYPLPPGLGQFPVRRVADYANRVPDAWREHGGVFIPMYQREALWLSFHAAYWRPNAVKIGIGKINAISGKPWDQELRRQKEDYIVVPDQPWLDGINAGKGVVRQFVAMPLGMGYTVEGQLTGKEEFGGIQIIAYDPKPGRFPDQPPRPERSRDVMYCLEIPCAASAMGIAAGGKLTQKIYPDEYGIDTWDPQSFGRVYVHIVNSMMYREITGEEPPATPVTAKEYAACGLPWFALYDEEKGDIGASEELAGVKSVTAMGMQNGGGFVLDDSSVEGFHYDAIPVKHVGPGPVKDGVW